MLITAKLIGTGKRDDSYRVNLPTYQLILGNISEGSAMVAIPDEVHGLSDDDLKHEKHQETTLGAHYPKLCNDCVDKINKNFDTIYPEHKGEFRLEQV